mmetsp:Transcript_28275/g.58752  ORF Transcript_28275/g.58752 Transcript_28275/m.58752 type:complete len:295 (+) Transcript_28275:537-1421(+)
MHPTPPSGRHLHRLPRCRGNGRDARRNRRIHHSFRRRLQSPIHRVEISDGWYAFERGHERPPVVPIFGHRFGRGARTHSGHGRIDGPLDGTAAEEEKGIQARRIESGRHVRHVGRHQIPRLFQQRPLIESARTDLPGRSVLHGRTREELRRSRGEDGHSDPQMRGTRGHSRLSDGRTGDRAGMRGNSFGGPGNGKWERRRRIGGVSPVLFLAAGPTAQNIPAGASPKSCGREAGSQSCRFHQHRRNVSHHRRYRLRHRPGIFETESVQSAYSGGVPPGKSHLAGLGETALRTCR